jgi:hypothetical protein
VTAPTLAAKFENGVLLRWDPLGKNGEQSYIKERVIEPTVAAVMYSSACCNQSSEGPSTCQVA